MRNALRSAGFSVHLFGYPSIRKSLDVSARALQTYVSAINARQIDFIAHSMGGLLLFHYFTLFQEQRVGKVVLMGTPLHGSAVASTGARIALLKPLLGANCDILQRGIEQWSAPGEVIMIAGTRRFGVGRILARQLAVPNDGTVAVAETRHPRLSSHYEISESHSSMLYSGEAIRIIRDFLD